MSRPDPLLFILLFLVVNAGYSITQEGQYLKKGVREYKAGSYYSALYNFIETLKINPANKKAIRYIKRTKDRLSAEIRPVEKDSNAEQARLRKQREKIELLKMKAELAIKKGDWTSAVQSYEQVLEIDPSDSSAQQSLEKYRREEKKTTLLNDAQKHYRRGEYYKSYDKYAELLELDSDTAQKGIDEIKLELKKILRGWKDLSPRERFCMQGFVYYIDSDYSKASAEFDRALTVKYLTKTKYILDDEELTVYLSETKGIVIERRKNARIKSHLEEGINLYGTKKYKKAKEHFQEVLKIDPGNEKAKNYIVDIDREIETERLLRKSAEKLQQIKFYSDKGMAQYERKEYSNAIESFEEVLKLDSKNLKAKEYIKKSKEEILSTRKPGEADKHYQQGLVYYSQGQLELAMKEFDITLRLNPDHEKAKQAFEKVKQEIELSK